MDISFPCMQMIFLSIKSSCVRFPCMKLYCVVSPITYKKCLEQKIHIPVANLSFSCKEISYLYAWNFHFQIFMQRCFHAWNFSYGWQPILIAVIDKQVHHISYWSLNETILLTAKWCVTFWFTFDWYNLIISFEC